MSETSSSVDTTPAVESTDSGANSDSKGTFDSGEACEQANLDDGSLPDYADASYDDGELDDGALPDYADHTFDDGGLSDVDLPDYVDASSQPSDWPEGESVALYQPTDEAAAGQPIDQPASIDAADEAPTDDAQGAAAQAEVQRALDIDEARVGVEAAYDQAEAEGQEPLASEGYEAEAEAWAAGHASEQAAGSKRVEFREPAPAKEVEFAPPGASEVSDGSGAVSEVPVAAEVADTGGEIRDPQEQQVIDDAKVDLVAHQDAGEVLGGDPVNRADQWHQQGQNDLGYQQDCALASSSAVLRDCGVDASESDVVNQAAAAGLCETRNTDPGDNGGVRDGEAISELLTEKGVPNQIENPQAVEDLAEYVEQGRGVTTEIDADELWGTPTVASPAYYDAGGHSYVNHAVQVTGTIRDGSGELTGFVINDTGSPVGAGTVVPVDKWDACWTNTNNDHETLVTEHPTAFERARR